MIEWLLEPLQYEFMAKAIVVSILVGGVCAVLSCFMVLRRWSLMGDAVSHSVLPGVALAYLGGIPFAIGAFVFGFLSVIAIGFVKARTRIKEDAVIGIVFSVFAFGLILISRTASSVDLDQILFGSVLGISTTDALQTGLIGIATATILIVFRRTFLLAIVDPNYARTIGIDESRISYALLALLALTVVAALQTVGVILVVATLITPGAIAHLLTDRFDRMLVIAVVASIGASVAGAYLSFYLDIATGGAIVTILAGGFVVVMALAPRYGIFADRRTRAAGQGSGD